MINFERVLTDLDVVPMMKSLDEQPELWDDPIATIRRDYADSAHHDVDAIFLRWFYPITSDRVFTDLRTVLYPAGILLAEEIQALLYPLLMAIKATHTGRVMIASLKAGGHIDKHVDEGPYADHFARFHIVLTSSPGVIFEVGNEWTHMAPGTAWWFDHKRPHGVFNSSKEPRCHLIIDAVTPLYPPARGTQ